MTARATTPEPAVEDGASQYVQSLVDHWDELIDWEQRKAGEGGFFDSLLSRAGARRVLDAAAGTGFHSVTLAEAGYDVTATDGSQAMIDRAASNARSRGVRLPAIRSDWKDLHDTVDGRFDAVLCLGSSFPHIFDPAERAAVLREFYDALEPGGVLVLDHRNFDAIRAHRYRSSGNYYYCGDGVQVSVAHIDSERCRFRYEFAGRVTHHLEVYPVLADELADLLRAAGFDSVERFGDFHAEYDPYAADFIIQVARKS